MFISFENGLDFIIQIKSLVNAKSNMEHSLNDSKLCLFLDAQSLYCIVQKYYSWITRLCIEFVCRIGRLIASL